MGLGGAGMISGKKEAWYECQGSGWEKGIVGEVQPEAIGCGCREVKGTRLLEDGEPGSYCLALSPLYLCACIHIGIRAVTVLISSS